MIINAVVSTGRDRNKIVEYIRANKYDGILGVTEFDAKGDTLNKTISVYKIKNGKFEYAQ
jgi:ABC-type branched-subunit amino acid transport system substrate-binding protein